MSDPIEPAVDEVLLNVTQEGVAMITLNRPHVHNAFNAELVQKLSAIFDDLEDQDGVRVVLIDGAGKSFSAGGDLTAMRKAADQSESEVRDESGDFALMLMKLRALPQPTVALVHGVAADDANPGGPVRALAVAEAIPRTVARLLRAG